MPGKGNFPGDGGKEYEKDQETDELHIAWRCQVAQENLV
jgi:hypothetical protein